MDYLAKSRERLLSRRCEGGSSSGSSKSAGVAFAGEVVAEEIQHEGLGGIGIEVGVGLFEAFGEALAELLEASLGAKAAPSWLPKHTSPHEHAASPLQHRQCVL